MAKMKSEFLAEWHRHKGATLRDRVFAWAPDTAKLIAGPLARVANPTMNWPPIRRVVAAILGVAPERKLPTYATRTFESWFRRHRPANPEGREVALFLDTYTNYYEPRVGQAMVRSLERLGCRVTLAKAGCCCRPMISKGFLGEAAKRGEKTLRGLLPFAERGVPIVALEPSCLSALRDDIPDLIDDVSLGKTVGRFLSAPDKLVEQLLADGASYDFGAHPPRYLLHGHCHQKALDGTDSVKNTLRAGGAVVDEVDSGCCGMAGSFGYEAEHYALSQKIGESRLFPAARSAGGTRRLIASGFSCRHQIAEATGRQPLHYAEALEWGLRGSEGGSAPRGAS
jgi:Fe-S oxidoreductase